MSLSPGKLVIIVHRNSIFFFFFGIWSSRLDSPNFKFKEVFYSLAFHKEGNIAENYLQTQTFPIKIINAGLRLE